MTSGWGFWKRLLGVPSFPLLALQGLCVGGGPQNTTDLQAHRPRSSGPPQMASNLPPTTHEKDLDLKIIVTAAQQTIQRGHYVPRERPRCWRCRERQQCSVLSSPGATHVLQPRPSHPKAYPHPNADSPWGTSQAHAAAHRSLRMCWLPPHPPSLCTPPPTNYVLWVLTTSPTHPPA